MIKTGVKRLRDPFILIDDGTYYMYGTDVFGDNWDEGVRWGCYKNTCGKLSGKWERIEKEIAVYPPDAIKNKWAPEVYKYKEDYYMFATYYSSKTKHRGTTILKADNPEGPFYEITDGHITPNEWDAIDGSLYIDENNKPWMVFVREYISTEDGVGRMAAAMLSEDFTHFISEPIELFRADAPEWAKENHVTDGCFIYKTKSGKLLMIWSYFYDSGYCVGVAETDNGKLNGKWTQQEKLLFSKEMLDGVDGGHGMIFEDADKKIYLCIHSNNPGPEETVILPLVESDETLNINM